MKNSDDLKRLKRFIVVTWSLLLAIIVGLVFWGRLVVRQLHDDFTLTANQKPEVIRGVDGKDGSQGSPGVQGISGITGQNGANGTNGSNGQDITPDQIATAVASYLKANPVIAVQGLSGTPGVDGQTLEIKVDPNTCILESKYVSSDNWNFLAQLPSPCSVEPIGN